MSNYSGNVSIHAVIVETFSLMDKKKKGLKGFENHDLWIISQIFHRERSVLSILNHMQTYPDFIQECKDFQPKVYLLNTEHNMTSAKKQQTQSTSKADGNVISFTL